MFPVGFLLQFDTKVLQYLIIIINILIKLFSNLYFEAGYLSPMVSILRYYILVSYRSQNYGIEPSLIDSMFFCLSVFASANK